MRNWAILLDSERRYHPRNEETKGVLPIVIAAVVNVRTLDWRTWSIGLLKSIVQGGAGAAVGALGPMATDPKDFNVADIHGAHHLMVSMLIGFAIAGMVHMFMFLQSHPIPDYADVPMTAEEKQHA
jgi:hypothetical protein